MTTIRMPLFCLKTQKRYENSQNLQPLRYAVCSVFHRFLRPHHCHVENEIIIDLKRCNEFELDAKHFYVNVGSGVTLAPVQQEAMDNGAYTVIGGGGAQCSAICNLIGDGWSPLSHRVGLPHRRILGTELVLPDGELVKMGSLAVSDDPFWGEGPGPT